MAYKRVQKVSNMMINYESIRLLDCVADAEEKALVLQTIVDYFENAREKGAEVQFEMPNVSKTSERAIKGMIESIDEGIYKFWKMVDKNTQARNKNNSNVNDEVDNIIPLDDHRSTTGQPQDNQRSTNIKDKVKDKVKENIVPGLAGEEVIDICKPGNNNFIALLGNMIKKPDDKSMYFKAVEVLQDNGFILTKSFCKGLANKIMFESLDEPSLNYVIDVCLKNKIYDEEYFFAVFNNAERWYKI